MSFDWKRKILNYDISSTLRPDRWTPMLQGLKKAARDARDGRAHNIYNVPIFLQYSIAVSFAMNLDKLDNVLELGTGYSSLIWGSLKPEGTTVYSMDGKPIEAYDIREPLQSVSDKVTFINGSTLTQAQLRSVYDGKSKQTFLATSASVLRESMAPFVQPTTGGYAKELGLDQAEGKTLAQVQDLLFEEDAIRCLSTVLPAQFEMDATYCLDSGPTAVENLLDKVSTFDVIFFDCGEFSTMPEWEILHSHIRPGGLAIFHDVHFPKSIKAFLICAFLHASPDWDILYTDTTTPQGLVVAKRSADV